MKKKIRRIPPFSKEFMVAGSKWKKDTYMFSIMDKNQYAEFTLDKRGLNSIKWMVDKILSR